MAPPLTEIADIQLQLATHLSSPEGWKAELAWLVDLWRTVYPDKWSPVSYRSSAGQGKFAGQRLTFYRCATQPASRPTSQYPYASEFQQLIGASCYLGLLFIGSKLSAESQYPSRRCGYGRHHAVRQKRPSLATNVRQGAIVTCNFAKYWPHFQDLFSNRLLKSEALFPQQ